MRSRISLGKSVAVVIAVATVTQFIAPLIAHAMASTTFVQNAYRWRNDDGSQTTATWKATANTAITGVRTGSGGDTVRLRFDLRETGGVSGTLTPQLEYGTSSACTGGTWTALDTSTTEWQLALSSNFADGDATTQQLSSGSFVAGRMSESSNPATGVALLSQVTDYEFSIKGVNATSGTTYYFRITNSGTALNTYTTCAQLTTASPTKIAYTTSARTVTAGTCSGAGSVITIQLQDSSNVATNPTSSTTVHIDSSSTSPTTEIIYSDSSCTTQISGNDLVFSTSENTKSFYIREFHRSNPTWTLTAARTAGDTLTSATQNITVNAASHTRLVITLPGQTFTEGTGNSGAPGNRTAGSSFTITNITATDDYFNIITGYSGAKTLVYSGPSNSPAPSNTAPSYTTSVSFTNGQSTTTLTTTLYRAQSTTVTTTDGGSFGYASSSVTVDPGILFDYTVSAATPITAGVCSTTSNTITAADQWDNPRTGDTSTVNMTTTGTGVTFYTNSGCGTSTTQYTLSGGTVSFFYMTTKKQSGITITATKVSDTPTGTSSSITVQPAVATNMYVVLPGQSFVDGTGVTGSPNFSGLRSPNATAGTSFTVDLVAVDDFDNLVDSGTNNFNGAKTIDLTGSLASASPSGQNPDFGNTSVTFTNGVRSQTLIYYNAQTSSVEPAVLTAPAFLGTETAGFIVSAGAMNNYNVVPAATSQNAGVAFNVTITARDSWNNPLGSLYSAPAGSYTWSTNATNSPDSSAPNLGTLTQGNFSSGVATKSVTLYKAESGVTFTAQEPSAGASGTSTSTVTVASGSISGHSADSSVTGNASVGENSPLTVTITLVDTWGNPKSGIASANIIVSATGSPSITQPSGSTNTSGQITGSLTWATAGSYTVSVQISGVSLVQNDGSTADADGVLDDNHAVTVTPPPTSTGIGGGTIIRGGTTLR